MVCSCSCRAFLVLANVGSSSSCDQWFDQSALLRHWVAKCKHKLDLYCLCWSILQNYAHTHTHSGHTHTNHIRAIFWKGLDLWSETTPGITSPKLKSFHAEMSDLTSTFDNYVTRLCLSLYVSVRRGRWDNLHHIFGAPQPRWASRKETELIEKMQFKPYNTSKGNQSNDDLRAGQCTVSRMKIWL